MASREKAKGQHETTKSGRLPRRWVACFVLAIIQLIIGLGLLAVGAADVVFTLDHKCKDRTAYSPRRVRTQGHPNRVLVAVHVLLSFLVAVVSFNVVTCLATYTGDRTTAEVLRRSRRLAGLPPDNISMNDDTAIPLTYYAAASTSATDTAQGGCQPRQPDYWVPEPRIFSGKTDEDMDAWLKDFDRVSRYYEWGVPAKLVNVVFFLTGTALLWFENHEHVLPTWDIFVKELKACFCDTSSMKKKAEQTLSRRAQLPGETCTTYIEEILKLCGIVNANMSDEDKVGHLLKGIAEDVYNFSVTKENLNTPSIFRQQCCAFKALKTRRILPKFGRLDNVPTVASMDVATCEDIPFLVRRVVREELVRLQAGDVHHQCSFAACPEPPPYWMRERHVENRPRTETADFTSRFPFSPTGHGHHRMSSFRRAAADLRPSSTRPLPEDYYAPSQNVLAEHDLSPQDPSATSAPANPLLERASPRSVEHLRSSSRAGTPPKPLYLGWEKVVKNEGVGGTQSDYMVGVGQDLAVILSKVVLTYTCHVLGGVCAGVAVPDLCRNGAGLVTFDTFHRDVATKQVPQNQASSAPTTTAAPSSAAGPVQLPEARSHVQEAPGTGEKLTVVTLPEADVIYAVPENSYVVRRQEGSYVAPPGNSRLAPFFPTYTRVAIE
ncbi:hypothetical protein HPB51_026006 [Rhipicephalus microplus]|uniref:Retrotransposon gag domain-containing protein n=1 Tax=Rhipicephalus microplus TaxID=6941 RepID=A0A9J6EDX5_RHIMP|nr:hypothetical protein HPB51_026006 [Rhipicephalus microplus]